MPMDSGNDVFDRLDEIPDTFSDPNNTQQSPKASPLGAFLLDDPKKAERLWDLVCKHFGITPVTLDELQRHKIGGGTQGEVFELSDGRALKFTWDEDEANSSAVIAKHPDPKGNVVKVDGVVRVKLWVEVWVIVMEKLTRPPMNDMFLVFADEWHSNFQNATAVDTGEGKAWLPIIPENAKKFFAWFEGEYEIYKENKSQWKAFKYWFMEIAKYLEQIRINYHDMWRGNIMRRGPKHVLIDLGFSGVEKSIIPTIAKVMDGAAKRIEKNR